jgi:Protein of unknown function (DUF3435)
MSPQDLGILLRQLWLYTSLYPLGRFLVQEAVVLLWSSITGTRPRVLVPPKAPAVTQEMEEGNNPVKKAGQARGHRQSDIPKFVRYDDLPKTVCYGDIELFVIRNPQGGSDIVVAVIDFRNLKGTE